MIQVGRMMVGKERTRRKGAGGQARLRQRRVYAIGAWDLEWEAALFVELNDVCTPMSLPASSPAVLPIPLPAPLIPLLPC